MIVKKHDLITHIIKETFQLEIFHKTIIYPIQLFNSLHILISHIFKL